MIWGLLVQDQCTRWPPTPVTLDTLSMETLPGLVGVMEFGVDQVQFVSVSTSLWNGYSFFHGMHGFPYRDTDLFRPPFRH